MLGLPIYLFENSFIDWLNKLSPKPKDFSNEVLPKLIGKIYTYHTFSPFLDIGSPQTLQQAQKTMSKV